MDVGTIFYALRRLLMALTEGTILFLAMYLTNVQMGQSSLGFSILSCSDAMYESRIVTLVSPRFDSINFWQESSSGNFPRHTTSLGFSLLNSLRKPEVDFEKILVWCHDFIITLIITFVKIFYSRMDYNFRFN